MVTFEDVRHLSLFENDINSFAELHVADYDFLFIDEIQYAKESGRKLKYLYDTCKTKIIISGSSSPDMSIESLRFLVGRIFLIRLLPFSFHEFLMAKDPRLAKVYAKSAYGKEVLAELNDYLQEFMLYGGYPRVVLSKTRAEKETVLRNIFNTFLLREIKELLGLSDNDRLLSLLKSLSLQIGNLVNYNELSSLTGFSFRGIKRQIKILEETYICERVPSFHTNKRTELIKAPKLYFYDSGFRNVCINNFSTERTDLGALYENLIFSELVKKGVSLKFWRTKSGAEVDFVIEEKKIPIEVKSELTRPLMTRSFQSFVQKYEPRRGYVVSLDYEHFRKLSKCLVEFLPFVKLFNVDF